MNKLLAIFSLSTTIFSMAQAQEIKLLHYNIKELDSFKINTASANTQLKAVKAVIDRLEYDIFSLNEVQYDLPNVPDSTYVTKGQNLQKLSTYFGLSHLNNQSFNIANTGLNALKRPDGTYYLRPNDPEARSHADQINFGTIPGQYSTGALFKYSKIKETVFDKLKWKDFNPNIDLSEFKTANGEVLPEDMQLFDKNFTDVILDVNGKQLHLILLHTVPAFHFGNMQSPNYVRNADQLKFLEWYLTGSTDFKVNIPGIKPLAKDAYYVAVGDWNTEHTNTTNPGSKVLNRFFSKSQLWIGDTSALTFTNEGSGYIETPFRLMLDYITYSKNIEILDAKIVHPNFSRIDLGCDGNTNQKAPADHVLVDYKDGRKSCKAYVHKSYKTFKDASDHYPLWGHFKLK